jgi:hypothetical protein
VRNVAFSDIVSKNITTLVRNILTGLFCGFERQWLSSLVTFLSRGELAMKQKIALIVLSLLLLIPASSFGFSVTFTDAEDSHIQWTGGILEHNTNYGNSKVIETANNGIFDTYGLIKFQNIFGSALDQISASSVITSAELHIWMSRESDYFPNTIKLYQLTKDWDELTVTGTNYGGLLNNVSGRAIDSYYKSADDEAVLPMKLIFDVKNSLLSWQNFGGITNFGWGIESVKLNAVNYFHSSDSGGDFVPSLTVNYETINFVPEPSTFMLLGSALVGISWFGCKRKKA